MVVKGLQNRRQSQRRAIGMMGIALLLCPLLLWGSDTLIRAAGKEHCFNQIDRVPFSEVGLVLGTNPKLAGGYPNPYYEARMDSARDLFRAGKVHYLLVSGDNGRQEYDEPTAMREDLIKRGVPVDHIVCDYAGFRTLDSVIRANKVFGQNHFTIISQHFHNERALYIAQNAGLDANGFDTPDPELPSRIAAQMWWRERFARFTSVLDAKVWQRKPRFFGPPVKIGT